MAPIWDFLRKYPKINLLTGVEGFRLYSEQNKRLIPSGYLRATNGWILITAPSSWNSSSFQVYHKSKLVPGGRDPPSFLKFMTPLFEKFGGTGGGYARQRKGPC